MTCVIELGAYPQATAEAEPIRWHVLERSSTNNGLLLVSDRILDCKRYAAAFAPTTWQDSDVRAWLDDEFLPTAFDAAERKRIRTTTCTDNGDGTPATRDRVFLLGVDEVRRLTDPPRRNRLPRRAATATDFARATKPDGTRLYVYDKTVELDYVVDDDGVRRGCSWWWLRTQPKTRTDSDARAAFVGARGDVKTYGRVNLPNGIRPAICVRP